MPAPPSSHEALLGGDSGMEGCQDNPKGCYVQIRLWKGNKILACSCLNRRGPTIVWRTAKASSREVLGEKQGGDSQLSLVKALDLVCERWCNGGIADAILACVRNVGVA